MLLLNLIGYKKLLLITSIIGYYLYYTDFIKELFDDLRNRFNFKKKFSELHSPTISTSETNSPTISTSETRNHIKIFNHLAKPNNNMDSMKFKDIQSSIDLSCNSLYTKNQNNIYKPLHAVPYNFQNSLNNNILYSINPTHTHKRIKYEKLAAGEITPSNKHRLLSTYNNNLESFNKFKQVSSYINLSKYNKCNIKNSCVVNIPFKFNSKLNLFTRFNYDEIILNWNIPILPSSFFPEKLYLITSKTNNNLDRSKSDVYSLPILFNNAYIKEQLFDIKTSEEERRITYILTTPTKYWKSLTKKGKSKYSIHSKIIYLFKTYDKNKKLNTYSIESNISSVSS